jgi:hypothetical protein
MSHLVAVIVDGDILTLDSAIRDGAKVDILAPLSGGADAGPGYLVVRPELTLPEDPHLLPA